MSTETSLATTASNATTRTRRRHIGRGLLVIALVVVIATQPALAQSATNPVCQDSSGTLANMIEGFLQITVALGVIGLLVVWQAESLLTLFTFNRDHKTRLKEHKRGAMRSAAILVVLGPLFTVAGSTMGLPIAECVSLIPF